MTPHFKLATTDEDFKAVGMLLKEYFAFLESVDLRVEHDATFNIDLETSGRAPNFLPPTGGQILALCDEQLAGCIALKKLEPDICEINRMYIRPLCRGKGLGRGLLEFAMNQAKLVGYKVVRLDTYTKLKSALKLYPTLGFKQRPSYFDYSVKDIVYFEKTL